MTVSRSPERCPTPHWWVAGADLLTFNNVVNGASIAGASDGGTTDTANDTIVFSADASGSTIAFAEGDDSLSLNRGMTNSTVVAAGGNDTVVAALTVAGSSIAAGDGADSLSVSVLSNSTITGASGADTITVAGNLLTAQVYGNQADSLLAGGAATSSSIFGGKGNDVLTVVGNVIGGNVEGNLRRHDHGDRYGQQRARCWRQGQRHDQLGCCGWRPSGRSVGCRHHAGGRCAQERPGEHDEGHRSGEQRGSC